MAVATLEQKPSSMRRSIRKVGFWSTVTVSPWRLLQSRVRGWAYIECHPRGDKPFALFCRDVRDAILPTLMGRRIAHGPEPKVLYFAKWRILDPNQGGRPSPSAGVGDINAARSETQEYEAIYKANVAVASYPAAQRTASRRKRSVEDDDDDNLR